LLFARVVWAAAGLIETDLGFLIFLELYRSDIRKPSSADESGASSQGAASRKENGLRAGLAALAF